ncbi:hypothetical protein EUTSA_v10012478mg [Eutrema salsugineum]|uniref:Uncharacterized protein n=1 Tax=Eutrema salsugineum TaxID=72664 RepID=V4LIR9_EUTSA|nr:hypothetical protein EUTSA_v10012478mg [Eutrema salsugineum]
MEKDILDISGEEEDYWLLKNTPMKCVTSFAGGNSGREKSYFDCSPLQIPRSNCTVPTRSPFSSIGRVTGNNSNIKQLSPSIDIGSVGKENTSGSNIELPKLSVERQQMKKKKRNAGFNLRKSLAWDRAFSTEEGVLDSAELSKITGNACQTGGDLLPSIQEEFRDSTSASKCTSVSPGLQALEENLFNDLPLNSKKREKKIVSGSLSKELSVSKVSTTKPDPVTVANNMKRTTQSPSKSKLTQPTQSRNSQKSLGSVSFSKSTSSIISKTKSSLASKSSIPKPSLTQSKRHVICKRSELSSVSNSQHSVVGKSNDGPMTTSDVDMLGHVSNLRDSNVITMGTTLAQSSCNRVGNTNSAVSPLGKPSGLRVPSPSIGYFSKSDSQPSHSSEDKHSQLPRSDVSSASRFPLIPTFKKPQFSEKVPSVNSKSAIGNTGSSGSAAGFSAQERVKVDLKNTREKESKVSSCSLSSQKNESLQQPCIIQSDTGKLVLDDVTICTSEKISTVKCCEDVQSSSELPPSGCKNYVQESNMYDDYMDEKRKTFCSVECPLFKDSMGSPLQGLSGASGVSGDDLKVSNPGELDICTTNEFSGDLDTIDVHGQPLNECVHPGCEEEISLFVSGEKDALIVNHFTENVAKQPEVLHSVTADPVFLGNVASRKSDVDDLSSSEIQLGNTESVVIPSGPVNTPDCVQSSCNHFEENANSILCGHNMVCDAQAVLEMENRIEVSDNTETNCDSDFLGPFPDCKDLLRESEEQHLLCQLVSEGKDGSHKIDVLTRNERADRDDGPDMQIDCFTGSPDVEQNMDQVKLLMPSSAENKMEDKPLGSYHESFSEKLTSEKHMQYNCSSVANSSNVKVVHVMKQTDQLGTSDGCCPAKDVTATVFSYLNEELENNSELEDMDLVTDSDFSDEEHEGNLKLKEVDLVTKSELISDLDEFSVKGILNQEYLEAEAIHTASDQCGKTKTLLSESVGDPEILNEDTNLSRISEGMSKEDSNSGCIEYNYFGKAETQIGTEKDFSAQVTDQELGSHEEEEEVQVIKIFPDPVAFVTTEEESGTPIPMNKAFSSRDDLQPKEFNVLSDDTLTSESNRVHASGSSSSSTCSSKGNDKTIQMDAKLEKKPDPIIVKPPNAVPFSDEWLAAFEAAGEEILTLKSGRVQHSPTDKSAPEPSPWSPVKKKNNQGVGPFDCTKYTNKGLPPALE